MPRTRLLQLGAALLWLPLLSCGSLWNAGIRQGLKTDARTLLSPYTGSNLEIQCREIAEGDNGYCTFTAPPEMVTEIAEGLQLKFLDPAEADYDIALIETADSCPSLEAFDNREDVEIYQAERQSIHIGEITVLENFFLFHNRNTDQICIHIVYAYG